MPEEGFWDFCQAGNTTQDVDQSINGNRLISYQEYIGKQVRRLVNDNQTELYKIWTEPEKRQHFVRELEKSGITFDGFHRVY